jgi:DNA-binding SARP family transcriptional activator
MDFRLLGPLEVHSDGQALDLGAQKQRALLALLLLEANRVVSVDRLIDALWDEEPPEKAQKALQVYVSQLRKLLGKERLQTKAPGYLLRVKPGELDLNRFQRLQEEGKLQEALALWRGPPLADFAYQRFAHGEIDRLDELRLACLEKRIERDLEQGGHSELVGELEALVTEQPLREGLRAQLMVALYRSGRQAEALEAYHHARRALTEELGIEPGRSLRKLHQQILNQDPALDRVAKEGLAERDSAPAPRTAPATHTVTRDVRKTVTAVFVGISVGSERNEELDPEALRRVTSRVFASVQAGVERHGATMETVAGDAITAVFGLPIVHEDDALRGARAAAEVRDALSQLGVELGAEGVLELEFRIGISTGEVVTGGDAGPQLRATGTPLTLSSRLAHAASPGEILVDGPTRRLLRAAAITEAANGAWRLLEVHGVPALAARLTSPMVGRERERRRLNDAFDQAVGDRSCQLFTVLGPAGVGKSRLVHEFLGGLSGKALVARGRCLPYGEGITFWPLLEAVKEAVGLEDSDSPDEARAKLAGALAEEPSPGLAAQRVAELIGLAEAVGGPEERFAAVKSLFEGLAHAQPLVLVFDDLHWGEETFLDLVEHLAERTHEAPILLACLARPELLDVRPGWGGGKLNATSSLLEPLSGEECSQLIENLVGEAELPEEVETRIAEAAEGNPLFVEEMLLMLIDDGLLVRESGCWIATDDLKAVPIPPTIQAVLAARIDRLDSDERAVIEHAAVEGKVFYEGALAELAPQTLRDAVSRALGSLLRKGLVRPERGGLGGRAYRFRHLLIRDAAYESIPKEARAEMHERFARWLEQAAGNRATEYEEIVGYHLEQAYRYRAELGTVDEAARLIAREGAERLGNAGRRRAFVRRDAPAAVNLISRAVALLPADDPLRVELVPNVRGFQGMGGDMSWADRVLTEAVEAAATTGNRQLAAHALVQRAFLRLFFISTEQVLAPAELIEVAERAIRVFEEVGDELGLARAWRLVGQAHYLARRSGLSVDASEHALKHVRRAGDRFEEREIVEWLMIGLHLGCAPAAEAAQRCERLDAEAHGDPVVKVHILGAMAAFAAMQQQDDEARKLIERCRKMVGELGEWLALLSIHHAFISLWLEDPITAESEIRPAYETLKKLGDRSHFSTMAHLLAVAVYDQGRYEEAEDLTRECEAAAQPNDVHSQIAWRSTRAKVLARRAEIGAAQTLAREAVSFASESDFHMAHGDALMDLAEVLELAGERAAAEAAVRRAIELFELKGHLLAADRARALLQASAR